ncbi:uncharacterized protein A4U43_C10F17380 [Asparagus officinalis]|uniref:Glycosyltransferase family 92 protein n=1 Tax=Asparagus officinalis TaxID=4686 RepID=A0A5P1E8B1_ASPOF|nr:uncharacterized protein A4U43_C10F17380 [Asparagus officinalis]
MKGHRKWKRKPPLNSSSSSSFSSLFFVLLCSALLLAAAFSTFRLFGVSFKPVLTSTWQSPALNAISSEQPLLLQRPPPPPHPHIKIQQAISFPDSILFFIKPSSTIPNLNGLNCLYQHPHSSLIPNLSLPAISSSIKNFFVRCPLPPQGFSASLSTPHSKSLSPVKPLNWDHLVYSAVLDRRGNTTVVFAKGLNLRSGRLSDANRYECVFAFDFRKPIYALTTTSVSAAQEVFRCRTPPSVLNRVTLKPPFVSIKTRGRGSITLPTIARPEILSSLKRKKHDMCVCTMVRNQARFLTEWIVYHSKIGVERWFIYDNNSDDDIENVVSSMKSVSLHHWPWIKTQEAGFAHCALRAQDSCNWVGFIDVDEFLYLPNNSTLHDLLRNYLQNPSIGELRVSCHSFGPSGRTKIPSEGVILGYTCRLNAPERHKSIIRPDALNPSLINIVHHFHLREGMEYVNLDSRVMVINHYKYQVWDVFKEKFYRRVATYVSDWKDEENVGSKDRAPGLGTKVVEPPDWSSRFCEVNDTGLRNWALQVFGRF